MKFNIWQSKTESFIKKFFQKVVLIEFLQMFYMWAPSPPTQLNPAIEVVYHTAANISADLTNLRLNGNFQFTDGCGIVFVHVWFQVSPRLISGKPIEKNQGGVRSGEWGAHSCSVSRLITWSPKCCSSHAIVSLAVWGGAPSCWIH